MGESPRISVRLPDDLRERAEAAAARDRRSLSQWVQLVIERALEALDKLEPEQAIGRIVPRAITRVSIAARRSLLPG